MKNTIFTTIILLFSILSFSQASIGNTAPDGSSQLDVASTTKGFLPPRMTYVQKLAISSPVAGLMVYCTDCGTYGELQVYNGADWKNVSGSAAATPPVYIGQSYQGGVVIYILLPGDPEYDANVQHGFIASITNQSDGIQWDNGTNILTGATGTALRTGITNTNSIIAAQGNSTTYAAGLARAHNGGGYSDWYLPSKDELFKLYENRAYPGVAAIVMDEYSNYWTSSEVSQYDAWIQNTNGGGQSGTVKSGGTARKVRAFRSF